MDHVVGQKPALRTPLVGSPDLAGDFNLWRPLRMAYLNAFSVNLNHAICGCIKPSGSGVPVIHARIIPVNKGGFSPFHP
jgi:hypothetical protein